MCDDPGIERASWYTEDRRRTRKRRRCHACGEFVEKGNTYVRIVAGTGSDIDVVVQCLRCHALFRSLQRASPGEPIAFALDCGDYIDDPEHPLQWLAFAVPADFARKAAGS